MATSSSQTSIEDIVTCPICMERMKNPKHLHCQHAFCENCLKNWITQPGNSKRSISCPVCRHVTPVRRGVHMLPTDIGVTRLLDMLDQQKQSGLSGFVCGKDGAAAIAFCESCSYHLCRDCVDDHVQNQTLWPHLLYLDDVCCSRHAGAVQDLYCQQCDRVGCRQCMTEQHKRHSITHLTKVAETNSDSMRYLLESLKDVMNSAEEQPDMINVSALESRLEELKQRIEAHASKYHTAVDLWKKTIIANLKQRGDNLAQEVSCVESQMEACSHLVSFISRFLEEASDYQLVAAFSATSQKLHKVTDSLDNVARRKRIGDYNLTFVDVPVPQTCGILINPNQDAHNPSTGNQLSLTANKLPSSGTLRKSLCSTSTQTTDLADSVPSTSGGKTTNHQATAQRQSFHKSMEFDVLVWENERIVLERDLHSGPYQQHSHMLKSFTQWLSGYEDEDLEAPVTVFMCNKTGFLYLGGSGWWTLGYLRRYSSILPPWEYEGVMTRLYPKAVAVSPNDGTIATSVGGHIELHKYGVIGRAIIRDGQTYIPVSHRYLPSINDPYGIAITNDNRWVVVDRNNCLVGIFKNYDTEFKHVATYGNHGDGPGEFRAPTYVCCDSMRGRFIVSDTGNNRIQVFNMPFDFLWQADGSDSGRALRKPRGLCLDGLGNILVADTGNSRIAVFAWQTGDWVKDVELDFMPHSVTVDGRDHYVAYLVVAGLRGKMPVITTLEFRPYRHSSYGWWE